MSRRVHEAVARGYNSASGIIAEKNRRVAASLAHRLAARAGAIETVDLGVGDGAMLEQLHERGIPSRMTGLDVSRAMLRNAAARVALRAVRSPAERALQVLPAGAFDLVLAHFIFAYVARRSVLEQARALLAPRGVLSLVTTTEEGGAPFHDGLERLFRAARHPLRRVIARAADRALAASNVPKSFAELERDITAAGMVILRRETMRAPVVFDGPEDAYRFGIDEGWAANILDVPGVPLWLARRAAGWGVRQAAYPFSFTHVVEMLEIGVASPGEAPNPQELRMHQQEERPPSAPIAVPESAA